jgi:hypothetical protein
MFMLQDSAYKYCSTCIVYSKQVVQYGCCSGYLQYRYCATLDPSAIVYTVYFASVLYNVTQSVVMSSATHVYNCCGVCVYTLTDWSHYACRSLLL